MAYHTSKISTPMDDEVRRGQKNSKTVRYGAALPLAAVMTMGLTLSMAGLIKAEFIPQDKTETANYEINPRVEVIPDPIRKENGDLTKGIKIEKTVAPLVRVPPVFPARFLQGNFSGYCRVSFDISPEGRPFNVQTTICTNQQLESATVKSVQDWKYSPEIRDGRPVSRSGLETIIRFDLQGERGELLPLPNGF